MAIRQDSSESDNLPETKWITQLNPNITNIYVTYFVTTCIPKRYWCLFSYHTILKMWHKRISNIWGPSV